LTAKVTAYLLLLLLQLQLPLLYADVLLLDATVFIFHERLDN